MTRTIAARSTCLLLLAVCGCDAESTATSLDDDSADVEGGWATDGSEEEEEEEEEKIEFNGRRLLRLDDDVPDVRTGAVTWEYVGMQDPHRPRAVEAPWRFEAPEPESAPATTVEQQLRETVRVDADGRVWRFKSLDREALDARLEQSHDAQIEAGFEPVQLALPDERVDPIVPESVGGHSSEVEDVPWRPLAWTREYCELGQLDRWDDDSRTAITTPALNGRPSAVVIVARHDPATNTTSARCSGTLVGRSWVLTAAHCVTDGSGVEDPPAEVRVAAGGGDDPRPFLPPMYSNFDGWRTVDAIHVPSSFNGTNLRHDYALVELDQPMNPATTDIMRISSARGAWEDSTPHNVSYPSHGPNCLTNVYEGQATVGTPLGPQIATRFRQRAYRQQPVDAVNFVSPRKIGTELDAIGAQSGSAIFRCGGGTCQNGETGWVMGILSAYFRQNLRWHNGGPNADQFRDWAEALIDD